MFSGLLCKDPYSLGYVMKNYTLKECDRQFGYSAESQWLNFCLSGSQCSNINHYNLGNWLKTFFIMRWTGRWILPCLLISTEITKIIFFHLRNIANIRSFLSIDDAEI